jgi:PAS domain S-box-containing protein
MATWTFERIIRILHVDYDVSFLKSVKTSLEANRDFQVENANSVSEAMLKLKFGKYDVIISDYQMPQKNGLEFLVELRGCGIMTPFILVADRQKAEVVVKALNLGVFRYVEKYSEPQRIFAELPEAILQAYNLLPVKVGLRENVDFLRDVYDNQQTGIIVIQPGTHIVVAANKAALSFVGAKKDQLIGKVCHTTICPAARGKCPITDLNQTIIGEEQVLTRLNCRQIPVLKTVKKVVLSGEEYLIESIVDISKRKVEEQKLKEKYLEYEVLFSENPQAIVFCDENFCIVDVNPVFTTLFGCSAHDVKGKDAVDMFTPENLKQQNRWIKQRLFEGHLECRTKRLRLDGSEVNFSLSGTAVCLNGCVVGFVLIFLDISEAVVANEELSRLIDEQNVSLGKIKLFNEQLSVTGGLTRHDIRNKLMALTFNAYIAKKHSGGNPDVIGYLTEIESISSNIARLLEFAKTFEVLGTQEQTRINVGKMVADAASLFANLKGVTVTNECGDFEVKADTLLMEVFHNMIDNSLKYGKPKITQIRIHVQISQEGVTELIYEDNGQGIEPGMKARLFQKGATTKGTGYGLWLIRRICEMYGWDVQETGEYGKGVRFVMKIP